MLNHNVLLSLKEFSLLSGLSLRTTTKLIASGELKAIRVGRRRLISRVELNKFIKRDHRISARTKATLRHNGKPKKRKDQYARRKKKPSKTKRARLNRSKKKSRKNVRTPTFVNRCGDVVDPRLVRALSRMRREGVSASEAARKERMKFGTFVRSVGRYLFRSGPGKPWKVRTADQLRVSMSVLTELGRKDLIVRNSHERTLLHKYELALRMFRAGEDGAEEALKAFEGKKVAGHTLVTSIKLLIELEEAGQLDFDSFYTSIGGRS